MTEATAPRRFLLRCDAVLADAGNDAQHDAALLVEDGLVESVGRYGAVRRGYPLAREVDRRHLVALPGFVDAHSHGRGVSTLTHGIADSPLEIWLTRLTAMTHLDPHDQALVAAHDLLATGVTTAQVFFHSFAPPLAYARELAGTVEGLCRSGIRFEMVLGITDQHEFIPPGGAARLPPTSTAHALAAPERGTSPAEYFEIFDAVTGLAAADLGPDLERVREALGGRRPALGPVAPQWVSGDVLEEMGRRVREGARMQTHLLESTNQRPPHYRGTPVGGLEEAGLLARRVSVAHGAWLEPEEIELLASNGVVVVHCPGSNTRLHAGIAPVRNLIEAGCLLAMGLDSNPVSDPPDVFAEMRHALSRTAEADAPVNARELMGAFTAGGAAATGAEIGGLQPGAAADVALVSPDEPPDGVSDFAEAVLMGASREDIRETFVGGVPVFSRDDRSDRRGVSAARSRMHLRLASDAPSRRRRLLALEEIEPWIEKLWEARD